MAAPFRYSDDHTARMGVDLRSALPGLALALSAAQEPLEDIERAMRGGAVLAGVERARTEALTEHASSILLRLKAVLTGDDRDARAADQALIRSYTRPSAQTESVCRAAAE